jgi:hypothetical protein
MDSVSSSLLFCIVLEALSRLFKEGLTWELLCADDLALLAKPEEQLLEKIRRWKEGLDDRGLKVNIGKTKVMKCQTRKGLNEDSGDWSCGVCRSGVKRNTVDSVRNGSTAGVAVWRASRRRITNLNAESAHVESQIRQWKTMFYY